MHLFFGKFKTRRKVAAVVDAKPLILLILCLLSASKHIYPSDSFRYEYDTNTPEIFAATIAATFVLVVIVFLVYDCMVKRRNDKLVTNAAQSNALVSNLFPGMFKDRVINERNKNLASPTKNLTSAISNATTGKQSQSNSIQSLDDDPSKASLPLADFFRETTIFFGDIVGFTSWSSGREPSQVFTLLEAVYGAFDKSAKRHQVFKGKSKKILLFALKACVSNQSKTNS